MPIDCTFTRDNVVLKKYKELETTLKQEPSYIGYLLSVFSLSRMSISYQKSSKRAFFDTVIDYGQLIKTAVDVIIRRTDAVNLTSFLPSVTVMLDKIFDNKLELYNLEEILQCLYKLITQLNGTTAYDPAVCSSVIICIAYQLLDGIIDNENLISAEIVRIDNDYNFIHSLDSKVDCSEMIYERCKEYSHIDICYDEYLL